MTSQKAEYKLSGNQNKVVGILNGRLPQADQALAAARKEYEHAKALFEARQAVSEARQAVVDTLRQSRDTFLSYILNEFELPASEEGWAIFETEPGVFVMKARIVQAAEPAEPEAVQEPAASEATEAQEAKEA